ncbi:S1 family peptidase [Streptomyces sp. URMC 123]|uniref:S1 family peptidase n=1 Tax=Streptomyces sp. URMC 123 TaxID=3423403 RepID=UPI003F19D459
MSTYRLSALRRRAALVGACVAALLATGTGHAPYAHGDEPEPTPRSLDAAAAGRLASTLTSDLRGHTAGAYYDAKARSLVVNVVDDSAARAVAKAGGRARLVRHSLTQLQAARRTLAERATVPGTSWFIDPVTNKVLVTADSSVTRSDLARLTKVVGELGDKARLERVPGRLDAVASGGDPIHRSGGRCSLGFNVHRDGEPYFLTAGHCGWAGAAWSDGHGNWLGTMVDAQNGDNDFALVKYREGTDHPPSEVNLHNGDTQWISQVGEALTGMSVMRSGSTTGVREGSVLGTDVTFTTRDGQTFNGMILAAVCAEQGDSGGSLFSGETALGLASAASGMCGDEGARTYFQPVSEALDFYGADLPR